MANTVDETAPATPMSNAEFVRHVFRTYLGREAAEAEVQYYVGLLAPQGELLPQELLEHLWANRAQLSPGLCLLGTGMERRRTIPMWLWVLGGATLVWFATRGKEKA